MEFIQHCGKLFHFSQTDGDGSCDFVVGTVTAELHHTSNAAETSKAEHGVTALIAAMTTALSLCVVQRGVEASVM